MIPDKKQFYRNKMIEEKIQGLTDPADILLVRIIYGEKLSVTPRILRYMRKRNIVTAEDFINMKLEYDKNIGEKTLTIIDNIQNRLKEFKDVDNKNGVLQKKSHKGSGLNYKNIKSDYPAIKTRAYEIMELLKNSKEPLTIKEISKRLNDVSVNTIRINLCQYNCFINVFGKGYIFRG